MDNELGEKMKEKLAEIELPGKFYTEHTKERLEHLEQMEEMSPVRINPSHPKTPWKHREFIELYHKYDGDGKKAMEELFPELTGKSTYTQKAGNYRRELALREKREFYRVYKKSLGGNYKNRREVVKPMDAGKNIQEIKHINDIKKFIELWKEIGSAVGAIKVLKPHLTQNSASFMAAQYATEAKLTMMDALTDIGITPPDVAEGVSKLLHAKKIKRVRDAEGGLIEEMEREDMAAIDKGITHAAKFGVGGGYRPDQIQGAFATFSLSDLLKKAEEEKNKPKEEEVHVIGDKEIKERDAQIRNES